MAPTPGQLNEMRELVREAMLEGAMGLGTALIYTPGVFASIDELVALNEIVAEYDGMYTSHIRSEGDRFEEAVQEVIEIAERTGVNAHIHHLKAAGEYNWHKLDSVIAIIEDAPDHADWRYIPVCITTSQQQPVSRHSCLLGRAMGQ